MNDQIIKQFPQSLELTFKSGSSLILSKTKSRQNRIVRKLINQMSLDTLKYHKPNNPHKKRDYQIFLNQFLLTIPEKREIKISKCKFYLRSENIERIISGIELIFIHSLVHISMLYIDSNNRQAKKSTFGYVIDFDYPDQKNDNNDAKDTNMKILAPFWFSPEKLIGYEICRSVYLNVEPNSKYLSDLSSSGNKGSSGSNQNSADQSLLLFTGLTFVKKVSAKLRKKISKRKNLG